MDLLTTGTTTTTTADTNTTPARVSKRDSTSKSRAPSKTKSRGGARQAPYPVLGKCDNSSSSDSEGGGGEEFEDGDGMVPLCGGRIDKLDLMDIACRLVASKTTAGPTRIALETVDVATGTNSFERKAFIIRTSEYVGLIPVALLKGMNKYKINNQVYLSPVPIWDIVGEAIQDWEMHGRQHEDPSMDRIMSQVVSKTGLHSGQSVAPPCPNEKNLKLVPSE